MTLLPPGDVARYRDGNKTDRADAKALLEAARNAALSRVPVKSVEQQAVVALHRLRQGYLRTRTARISAVRGHLREFGYVIPVGAQHVLPRAYAALAEDTVPAFLRPALESVLEEIGTLAAKAEALREDLAALARQMPAAQLLPTVPGVGVLTDTALVGFVGDVQRFRSGGDFAAYLGLTPREHSSGARRHLGTIPSGATATCRCCSYTAPARRCAPAPSPEAPTTFRRGRAPVHRGPSPWGSNQGPETRLQSTRVITDPLRFAGEESRYAC